MDELTPETWRRILSRSSGDGCSPLYGPLSVARCFVLGRLAQSLDGYIATRAGQSQWISGPADIAHTHRLRALADAVVVGAGTVLADDPRLTTRLVEGSNPVRVVLDPSRKLGRHHNVFDDQAETILVVSDDAPGADSVGAARVLRIPHDGCGPNLDLTVMLDRLAARGLRRIFVEGGGITVSRFLAAGLLDRLHVTVSPVLMGAGIKAFPVTPVSDLKDARRFGWSLHPMGSDVLLDIPLYRV
jgi:diaminohydroxyphosphoribosylaminopyrimidine deaminase / 5-amino-6-(5-phosphoribosylamino)uracil reductase